MTNVSFTVPESMLRWLEQRVTRGDYVDVGDYLRELLRREQEGASETAWFRREIIEGLSSELIDKEPEDVIEEVITARRARHGLSKP